MPTYKTSPFNTDLQSAIVVADDIDNAGNFDCTGEPGAMFALHLKEGDGQITYLNIYDNGNPVLGTTEPDWIFPVSANADFAVYIDSGIAFSSALSLIASVSAGGAAGASPTNLDVRVFVSDTTR